MAVPGSYPPAQRAGMYDRTAGLHCVAPICAALLHREKTGLGQEFELSLYHVGVYNIASDIQNALMGLPTRQQDRTKAGPLWNSIVPRMTGGFSWQCRPTIIGPVCVKP